MQFGGEFRSTHYQQLSSKAKIHTVKSLKTRVTIRSMSERTCWLSDGISSTTFLRAVLY